MKHQTPGSTSPTLDLTVHHCLPPTSSQSTQLMTFPGLYGGKEPALNILERTAQLFWQPGGRHQDPEAPGLQWANRAALEMKGVIHPLKGNAARFLGSTLPTNPQYFTGSASEVQAGASGWQKWWCRKSKGLHRGSTRPITPILLSAAVSIPS